MIRKTITTVEELQEEPIGTIRVTTPLMCYILEKIRTTQHLESSKVMLLCEKLANLSADGRVLTIDNKGDIFDIWWAGPNFPSPIIESTEGNTCPTV